MNIAMVRNRWLLAAGVVVVVLLGFTRGGDRPARVAIPAGEQVA